MAATESGASDEVTDADAGSGRDSGEDKRAQPEEEEVEVDMTLSLDDLREIFSDILGVTIPSQPLSLD